VTTSTESGSSWYINDTTVIGANVPMSTSAVAHSSTSYEVIGYFTSAKLSPFPYTDMPSFIELGRKTDTSTWTKAFPLSCGGGTTTTAILVNLNNKANLPPALFTKNNTLNNVIDLGNGWTYTVDKVIGATPKQPVRLGRPH
jgi:hypothetical protein